MGSLSMLHWLVVAIVVLVLFGGRGKVSGLMGELGKGISSFRKGIADGQRELEAETRAVETEKV